MATLMATTFISCGFGIGWWFYGVTSAPEQATILRIVGIAILIGLVAWVMSLRRHGGQLPDPGEGAKNPFGKQYGIAVLLMVVAIFAGSRVLTGLLGKPEAVATWILFCVGVHFIPFTKIFGSTRFRTMALLLCGVAILATVLGSSGQPLAWPAVTGFGGAIVMWGTVIASLRAGHTEITRQINGSPL
ncbi:hypothetical protein LWC34_08785 [Kibdelosporangium philippinense]|uniref:Uncharacterized protein n=1 Tax=Kibdelosporangium philippinense TaxID=211113 RepID=A0ABS8Z603_9PSEU|nr:hypothetical protein [Kibdelosporangium philippinense]MCE7002927.1 hypothetical protein [Kibdelosporangium philippinense]